MHNSEAALHTCAGGTREMIGGRPEVQEWEIAVLHRCAGAGGGLARLIWGRGDPAAAERMLDAFRMTMMPRMEELPGFCSVSLLVDRGSGRWSRRVVYESRAAIEAHRERPVRCARSPPGRWAGTSPRSPSSTSSSPTCGYPRPSDPRACRGVVARWLLPLHRARFASGSVASTRGPVWAQREFSASSMAASSGKALPRSLATAQASAPRSCAARARYRVLVLRSRGSSRPAKLSRSSSAAPASIAARAGSPAAASTAAMPTSPSAVPPGSPTSLKTRRL